MEEKFLLTDIKKADPSQNERAFLDAKTLERVWAFHRSFPAYNETPLAKLDQLAKSLGLANVWVKDESYRFGLNAFKVLGGSYAMGVYLAHRLGIDPSEISYEKLVSPEAKAKLGELTFVTATDGNHGRGVAWTARELGHRSVVYMPEGSSEERLANIRAEGAEASITDMNYDDAVRLANQMGEEKGWIMVQDTAWEGYEEIPANIMQGYATLAFEATKQLGDEVPTHVFLQAGVGSMAGGVAGFLGNYYGDKKPTIVVVEPNKADCIYRTAEAKDDQLHFVTGKMDTIMAGLACGEPNMIGWKVLTETADFAISCPDFVAAQGMRILGNPIGDDVRVISGESGAVTTGIVAALMTREDLKDMRDQLGLNQDSKVLCISTEGDTDREHYRRVVWDGLYPNI